MCALYQTWFHNMKLFYNMYINTVKVLIFKTKNITREIERHIVKMK